MKTLSFTGAVMLATLAAVPACGKTKFGVGCEKAVQLTSPWTDLSLPIDEKKTRVCESSSDSLKLRSYTWTTESEAQSAFKAAMTGAGWVEDRCGDKACYYDKDGYQVSVQPAEFKIRKKKLVTIMMRRRKDPTQKTAKTKD